MPGYCPLGTTVAIAELISTCTYSVLAPISSAPCPADSRFNSRHSFGSHAIGSSMEYQVPASTAKNGARDIFHECLHVHNKPRARPVYS